MKLFLTYVKYYDCEMTINTTVKCFLTYKYYKIYLFIFYSIKYIKRTINYSVRF